jgi:hypothetical protein
MRSVLQHVAALAKCAQIGHPIIGRIAIEVCRCEHDARCPEPCCLHEIGPSSHPSAAVSPRRRLLIEPASVRQTANKGQMSPTATLALSSRTFEANVVTELTPVGRVQRSQLSAYRHGYVVAGLGPARWSRAPRERPSTQPWRAVGALVRGRAGGSISSETRPSARVVSRVKYRPYRDGRGQAYEPKYP